MADPMNAAEVALLQDRDGIILSQLGRFVAWTPSGTQASVAG